MPFPHGSVRRTRSIRTNHEVVPAIHRRADGTPPILAVLASRPAKKLEECDLRLIRDWPHATTCCGNVWLDPKADAGSLGRQDAVDAAPTESPPIADDDARSLTRLE